MSESCNINIPPCPFNPMYTSCPQNGCTCPQIPPARSVTCEDLSQSQSDMRLVSTKGVRGPSLTNVYTPIEYLPKNQGLGSEKPALLGPISKIPETWSWKDRGGSKISPVFNQCQCGCCWAVAATTALADRFGIKGTSKYSADGTLKLMGDFPNGIKAPALSPAWTIMKIGPLNNGPSPRCQCSTGGSLAEAGCGFQQEGAKLEKCYPFSLYVDCNTSEPAILEANKAQACCSTQEQKMNFKIVPGSTKRVVVCNEGVIDEKATHLKLKAEIANHGPVPASFLEYANFQANTNSYYNTQVSVANNWDEVGVYIPKKGSDAPGGHAVVITGWGIKDGQEFWEIRNSWGVPGPGDPPGGGGYFKYAITMNDPCHLAVPALEGDALVGGAISFLPGDLPSGFKPIGSTGKRRSSDNYGIVNHNKLGNIFRKSDGTLNWPVLVIIFLIISILIISLLLLIPKRK